jgi:hypothetical protein
MIGRTLRRVRARWQSLRASVLSWRSRYDALVERQRSRIAHAKSWALYHSEPTLYKVLTPVNGALCVVMRGMARRRSVLHISYMVHVPYYMVGHLRRQGVRADYLGIGPTSFWSKCDYNYQASPVPLHRILREFWIFWSVIARYEVVHAHFMYTLTATGWELPLLKRMGRRLVVNFRGCEARDRTRNMALHPDVSICQNCEHQPYICESESARRRRDLARRFGDAVLVTTPDMLEFVPEGTHFPFFSPPDEAFPAQARRVDPEPAELTIVHLTAQPGIEGTRDIERVIERLQARGRRIRFEWIRDAKHHEALAALQTGDIAIGKMKMGYYANAQIEAMMLGIPTITHVRPEFMTDELRRSGFIFATLPTLEATIEHYLDHPEELAEKRRIARQSIMALHDNDALARRLCGIYGDLVGGSRGRAWPGSSGRAGRSTGKAAVAKVHAEG